MLLKSCEIAVHKIIFAIIQYWAYMKFQREKNGSCSASSLKHSMMSILTIDNMGVFM